MKRILSMIILLGMISTVAWAGLTPMISLTGKGAGVSLAGSTTGTDYTKYASCCGAWLTTATGTNDEIDISSASHNLTASGTINTSSTVPSGYTGTSRNFNSESLRITDALSGTLDINGAGAVITMTGWVYPTSLPSSGLIAQVFGKHNQYSGNSQYSLRIYNNSGTCYFDLWVRNNSGSYKEVLSTTSVSTNTWYHVALVSDNVSCKIYVNGVLDGTPDANTAGIYNGNGDFRIGQYQDGAGSGGGITGYVKDVGVWSEAFAQSTIQDIMANGINGKKGAS